MSKIVGIDLGTTNSVVAVMEGGQPTVIPNAEGNRTTPSVVAFSKNGEILVGELAKRKAIVESDRVVSSIKRKMGTDYRFTVDGKDYSPEEISAMILRKLKEDAEKYLGEPVKDAVITVPAYFNDAQRQATKNAGKIAGLNVLRIINEPTASSLAYGLDKQDKVLTILVFDLGGGTFDVSILEIGEGVYQVKATAGDNHLGGDDWDQRIIDWMIDEFKKDTGIDLNNDKTALQRLKEAAEKAKKELSSMLETHINLPFIYVDQSGPKHLDLRLTRAHFEQMTKDLLERCEGPTKQAMADAGLTPNDIDKILLVGGSTRMPMVVNFVKNFFNKEPNKDINPDECVALGAAIQGAVLKGEIKDVVLVDVTPLTLSIETLGGVSTPMIKRNTAIPTSKTEVFTTAADNQTAVEIHVLQGERPLAKDNKSLGKFILTDIPPAPRGVPQIEVTFEIDHNGILNVSAKDKATGKTQSIQITGSTNLSKEDVERMVKEAEARAKEDKKIKEAIEARNQADSVLYNAKKTLESAKDKIDDTLKKKVEDAIKKLEDTMKGNDAAAINKAREELTQAIYEVSTKLYQKVGATAGGSGAGAGAGFNAGGFNPGATQGNANTQNQGQTNNQTGKDDVIDADYKVEE